MVSPVLIQGASVGDPAQPFTITNVVAVEPRVVKVIFSDRPRHTTPDDSTSVDNPGNWSFTFELTEPTFPVCHVNAKNVVEVPDTEGLEWYIELDQDQSLDALYTIHASTNITDVLGFPPADSSLPFSGFRHTLHINHRFEIYLHFGHATRKDVDKDQRKFLSMVQEMFNCLWAYADRLQTFADPTQMPYGWDDDGRLNWHKYVDRTLDDLGNPFNITISLATKKKLALVLVALYKQKGTSYGIINAIRVLLGIEVEVIAYNTRGGRLGRVRLGNSILSGEIQHSSAPWYLSPRRPYNMSLGRSRLGGPSDPIVLDGANNLARRNMYSFRVVSPVRLTDTQRNNIRKIVQYMKPSHTHLDRIVEPALPVNHLALGKSRLGSTSKPWKLH